MKLLLSIVALAAAGLLLFLFLDGPPEPEPDLGREAREVLDAFDSGLEAPREAAPAAPPRIELPVEAPDAEPLDDEPPEAEPPADPARDAALESSLKKLEGGSTNDAFKATVELGELGDDRAVPALMTALTSDRDFYIRLGAATALAQLEVVDAVPALIDALDDKDELVRTAARDALQGITGHDEETYSTGGSSEERKVGISAWRVWWKHNERALRTDR